MSANTYKMPREKEKRSGFFSILDAMLRIDEELQQVIHVRFLPQIIFLTFLAILYIGSRHYAEKKIRSISTLEREVEDLRADYTTLKADYMFASKQSEVAKKAAKIGLTETNTPPKIIVIEE